MHKYAISHLPNDQKRNSTYSKKTLVKCKHTQKSQRIFHILNEMKCIPRTFSFGSRNSQKSLKLLKFHRCMYLSGVRAGALGLWIDIQCSILLPSSNGSQLEGCCVWRAVIQLLYSLASSWLQLVIDMATTWWQLDHIEQSPNSGNSALFSWEHVLKAGIFLLF